MITSLLLAAAEAMTFTADRIAADNVTHALAASGHVVAVQTPYSLRSECLRREADGRMTFADPTCVTTCTNDVGHTHWNLTGEVEYQDKDHVIVRNAWLSFYEIPVFWLPYMYYPLETDCGFSWMPGYTGHWGAYLLTKYRYHLLGDPTHDESKWWLDAATRFDLRYVQGLALGEDLSWNLGDFGAGKFSAYYAWDEETADKTGYGDGRYNRNWGSPVDRHRYGFGLEHRLEPTERDAVRVQAAVYSDSYFRPDFQRTALFDWQSSLMPFQNSGVFWEHVENSVALGAEASGRLNEFYAQIGRLPEIYLDVNPQPLLGLPVNYESQNRIGYLTRDPAEYGDGRIDNPFAYRPGRWAEYETFRFDTYHRLSAPFRTLDDLVSAVPRVGYHGTGWNATGRDNLTGRGGAESAGAAFRSILEGGVTLAGRGTAWIDEKWRHVTEPYLDVLAQKAWYGGLSSGERPYVFDAIDASAAWEDQFAGRSRNLPYTYYGVTPGWRNAWDAADAFGHRRTVVDADVYAALQFGETDFVGTDDAHKLARTGRTNYGKSPCYVSPGARLRWAPAKDLALMGRAEYDPDRNTIASGDVGLKHEIDPSFSYYVDYAVRDFRWWDFSSAPYVPGRMTGEDLNYAKMHFVTVGFENHPIDWFAWSPFLRWDIQEAEMDGVGAWFDYLTDCLGFRLLVEYENAYTYVDGFRRDDDFSVGFYIYLRAFGADSMNIFK